ncbi:MAG: CRISPR-associated endonuclease Cas1 [Terriglobales bacterium]
MAATENVRQVSQSHNPSAELIVPRHGVVTVFGYGIQVRVDRGHLLLEDGIGPARRYARLPRVRHGLKRLVVIGSDGVVSLAALRWLADQDASFAMLERNGKVLAVTGPVRPSDAKLRRAQAVANSSGVALRIARDLISQKLAAQERVVRHKLLDSRTADAIARFQADLPNADGMTTIRLIESQAARVYWGVWSTLPINFPKNDLKRVPEHWRSFGTRVSPLTGSPRLAANPPNAILNYLYALLESESRLAAAALGLDPGIGVLHADTPARDSLACDLMEPTRPQVDAYLLDWITRQPLRREWFFEERDGNCRLMGSFAAQLSETARVWRRAAGPFAEWVARAFWATIRKPDAPFATRLTQNNKREAKGAPIQSSLARVPSQENLCAGCGKPIRRSSTHCPDCSLKNSTALLISGARLGRVISHGPQAQARRKETKRLNDLARSQWSPSSLPAWLTQEAYVEQIQPRLRETSLSQIASAVGVSIPYASDIRKGRRCPHPRHWEALAKLAGVSVEGEER